MSKYEQFLICDYPYDSFGAIYVRYSSDKQRDSYSVEGQLGACYEYARGNKISVVTKVTL